jgi:pseudaminic acid biosynthesis-associated methylase
MNTDTHNDQQSFWAGDFGNKYIDRNTGQNWIANNTRLFANILLRTGDIKAVLEFGANIGLNLIALKNLLPDAELSGIEINENAFEQLSKIPGVQAYHSSIEGFEPAEKVDLAFTKTVLIHINPASLDTVYDKLYSSSRRYVLIAEYYNPTPVEIQYRGHSGKLFKRDFAGEMMERHQDLQLIDYGFMYHGDNHYHDDLTWFLMEKSEA